MKLLNILVILVLLLGVYLALVVIEDDLDDKNRKR